jgi:hypothetical protein
MPCQPLNGWTVCASTAREAVRLKASGWHLPARRENKRDNRALETHKVTAVTWLFFRLGKNETPFIAPRLHFGFTLT